MPHKDRHTRWTLKFTNAKRQEGGTIRLTDMVFLWGNNRYGFLHFELFNKPMSVISFVGDNGFEIDFMKKRFCFRDVGSLPWRQGKNSRIIDDNVDLHTLAATRPSDGLIRPPLTDTSRLGSTDDRNVDHHVLIIVIIRQMSKNLFAHPLFAGSRRCAFFQPPKRTGRSHQTMAA